MKTDQPLRIGLAGAGLWGTRLGETVGAHNRTVLEALTKIDADTRDT